jgi:hypothetical protein
MSQEKVTPWDSEFVNFVRTSVVSHLSQMKDGKLVGSSIMPKGAVVKLEAFKDLVPAHEGTLVECVDWLSRQESAPFIYPEIKGAGAGYRLPGFVAISSPGAVTKKWLTDEVIAKLQSLMTANCSSSPVSVEFLVTRSLPDTTSDADIQACCDEVLRALSAGMFEGFARNGVKSRKVVRADKVEPATTA